jgi:hypothetical protein
MDIAEVTQLIGDLQAKVEADPAGAAQKIAELKEKFSTLPPEQQEQVQAALAQLRERAQNLPPELQQQLGDIASTIRSAAPSGIPGGTPGGTPTG